MKCSVPGCPNKQEFPAKQKDRTYHLWTKHNHQRLLWMTTFGMNFVPYGTSIICSDHFGPDDFVSYAVKKNGQTHRRILPSAVPTLNLGPLANTKKSDELHSSKKCKEEVDKTLSVETVVPETGAEIKKDPWEVEYLDYEGYASNTEIKTEFAFEEVIFQPEDANVDYEMTSVSLDIVKIEPNMCRVCSIKSNDQKTLFEGDTLTSVAQKLVRLLQIDIHYNDGFPCQICPSCVERLEEFDEFKKTAHAMHKVFQNCINNQLACKSEAVVGISDDVPHVATVDHEATLKSEPEIKIADEIQFEADYSPQVDGRLNPSDSDEDEHSGFWNKPTYIEDEMGNKIPLRTPKMRFMRDAPDSEFRAVSRAIIPKIPQKKTIIKIRCPICDKDVLKSQMKIHLSRHSSERPFQCSECTKRFKIKNDLMIHMRSHTEKRRFVCDICAHAFRSSSALRNHIRSHSDECNHKCLHCPAAFKTQVAMMRHHNIHHNKRYKCEICDKEFGTKERVKRHLKVHEKRGIDVEEARQTLLSMVHPKWNGLKIVDESEISKIMLDTLDQ